MNSSHRACVPASAAAYALLAVGLFKHRYIYRAGLLAGAAVNTGSFINFKAVKSDWVK